MLVGVAVLIAFFFAVVMTFMIVSRLLGAMIVAFVTGVSVCRVLQDPHVRLPPDLCPDSPFHLGRMQQEIAEWLVNHGEHPFFIRGLHHMICKLAIFKDLQDDLRRAARYNLLRCCIEKVDRDRVRRLIVRQLRVILLLTQHNQMASMRTRGIMIVPLFVIVNRCIRFAHARTRIRRAASASKHQRANAQTQ